MEIVAMMEAVTLRNSLALGILTLLLALLQGTGSAADLTGTVTNTRGAVTRDAVVSLEGGTAAAKPIEGSVINQRKKMFVPHVIAVTTGTTVSFPNDDSVLHNVFAYYDAKKFDLGMYPRGTTKRETFGKAGVVALLCNIHSEMSAYIVVVDTPYYAVSDKDGKFVVHDVPPGKYTLKAWHETGASASQAITVGSGGTDISVALVRK
ncbi:MAG TPA: carboxypeptidase regulatory-like domain-containing protein [Capsulimonadaceae bacterium]|jgi:plastocyanin